MSGDGVFFREDQPEERAWPQQVELILKGIVGPFVCLANRCLETHHVYQIDRARDEYDLHHGIVKGDVAPQKIQVAEAKHHGIHFLHPARDSHATFALLQLEDEQHDAHQMQHVAAKPKDVHG
eukprot:CAMPEP_0198543598 /NCGR_PEP_ID=MMETSP1462-20131121/59751_1 /TAXON_ID=1333877 /ORGANISM="Brandtodinium nutriculum, Strain RCC3387" /LENGTH=122 /DNA_ID=CAMNT_0044273885 /DNA_START=299 /DNA_END=666 /DNA_ORIENTATION=-